MAEGFQVEPAHLAGYGNYLHDVHPYLASISAYVHHHGRADGRYRGLVGQLAGTADANADAITGKVDACAAAVLDTAQVMQESAWVYTGAEESAYRQFNDIGASTGVAEFPGPAPYHPGWRPNGGELDEPTYQPGDIEGVFDMEGVLGMLNDFVNMVTGFDPMAALGELISGDWGVLNHTGDVMTTAGVHLDAASHNLTEKLPQLRAHWQGRAAAGFEAFNGDLAASVAGIGPVAELFGGMFRVLAHVVEFAARAIKDTIQAFVDRLTDVSFFGVAGKLWDLAEAIITAFTMAKDLFSLCKELVEGAKALGGLGVDYLSNAAGLASLGSAADGFAAALRSGADRLGKTSDYGQIIAEGAGEYLGSVEPAIEEMEHEPVTAPPAPYELGTPEGTVGGPR